MFDRAAPTDTERFLPPLINSAKAIARPRLMALMTESAKRGVLFVHAPAGYGKISGDTAGAVGADTGDFLTQRRRRLLYLVRYWL